MRKILLPTAALTVTLALAACAPTADPGSDTPSDAVTPVIGQGTVIQVGDAAPELCLGAIAESYPPQCSGPELTGWDWASADGQETASDVTWGTYAVWGDWNGTTLAVTSQIQLALYDPMPILDPAVDPANAGTTAEAELVSIQDGIATTAPVEVLGSWIENGYLFVSVVTDDGTVQAWADETYGPDVVQVRPALRVIE